MPSSAPAVPERPPLLAVRNLSAGYGGLIALNRVSLEVAQGAVLALLGANGAGKSTLLKVIAGEVRARTGGVAFDGERIDGRPPWEISGLGVCYVPEGGGVFHELTVADNLLLASPGGADLDRVYDLFPVLAERRSQGAGSLSGGEKRMLSLSRAILGQPRVLLVDEPSLGLAPVIVDRLFEVLGVLRDEGITVVLVEQYVDRALELADHAAVLAKGLVRYRGTAEDLAGTTLLEELYLGRDKASGHAPPRRGASGSRSSNPRQARSARRATRPRRASK